MFLAALAISLPIGHHALVLGALVVGVAMVAFTVVLRGNGARKLRASGRNTEPVLVSVLRAPLAWLGIALIVGAFNATAGGVLLVILGVTGVVIIAWDVAKGVRAFPAVWRRIGDPDAWRGRS